MHDTLDYLFDQRTKANRRIRRLKTERDLYKRALELAAAACDINTGCLVEESTPEYWIEQAEKLKTTHVDSE